MEEGCWGARAGLCCLQHAWGFEGLCLPPGGLGALEEAWGGWRCNARMGSVEMPELVNRSRG